MKQAILDKMRADFVLIADMRIETGEWTDQDRTEVSQAIRAAIESKDEAQVAMWSRWLADLACWITAWKMICPPINDLIRLKVEQNKAQLAAQPASGQKAR